MRCSLLLKLSQVEFTRFVYLDENAILRVSVHQEDNMDISIVRASTYVKNDTPITSLEEEETTDVETVEEDGRDYAPYANTSHLTVD